MKRYLILIIIILAFAFIRYSNIDQYLSIEYLKQQELVFRQYYSENTGSVIALYFLVYIINSLFALPGATIITLAGGAIFGLWLGVIIVSFASTIGATLSFLLSRYLFRDKLKEKFSDKLKSIDEGLKKDGATYLFSLRMVPLFPFFLINVLFGLTEIPVITFYFVSQLGMLPGTIAYINAGTQLANLHSTKGILSFNVIISFAILGLLPLLFKWLVNLFQRIKIMRKYKKPSNFDYNIITIGAGSAGLVTSLIGATVKAKVALVEKNKMGGDCLNTGCIPSKSLIAISKKVHLSRKYSTYNLDSANITFDFEKIMNRVHSVIQKIAPNDSIERYSKMGVDCFTGFAHIIDPYTVEVNGKKLTAKNIVIASGAEPFIPQIPNIEKVKYLTSETLWDLKKLPNRLLVLGGGPIGCELSQAFSRLGSKVTLLEMSNRLLPREDSGVSDFLTKTFLEEGMQVLTSHKAIEFLVEGNQKFIIADNNGDKKKIEFDEVIFAIGRKPRTKGFGLEELGIEFNPNGTIQVDKYLRTSIPNIFACGDVVGPYQFTHTASHQAWYASVNSLFGIFRRFQVDYRVIPWTTFTDPEIAHVGITEKEAKDSGIAHQISVYDIGELDRAIADGEAKGFIKVITKANSDKILGVTIVSQNAGELLAEYVLAMKYNLGLNKILGTIHSYPTMSEANKYVAGIWKKSNKPEKLLSIVEKFHRWMR